MDYAEAFSKYQNNGELVVRLTEWDNDDDYGVTLYINDHECGEVMHHPEDVASRLLEFLNIPAKVEYSDKTDDLYQIP